MELEPLPFKIFPSPVRYKKKNTEAIIIKMGSNIKEIFVFSTLLAL